MQKFNNIWSILKRYWREIAIGVSIAISVLSFAISGRRIQEGLDQVNEILDQQREDIEQRIETVEKQKTTSIQIIERSERRAENIETQIENIKPDSVSTDAAVQYLKNFADKKIQ
jgi:predicted S18 family serine protease